MKDKDKTKEQLIEELEKLHQELHLYKMIVEKMPLALTVWKLEGLDNPGSFRLLACNPQIEKATGAPYREFVGTTVQETFPSSLETEGPHIYAEAVRTGQVRELPDLHFPGDEQTAAGVYSVTTVPLGGRIAAIFCQNITESKRAEKALELKVKQLATLSQASQAATASLELEQVLAEIVSLAGEVIASDYAGVVLVDEAGHLSRSAETLPGVPAIEYRVRDEGLTNWIIRSRRAVIIEEIGENGAITPDLGKGAPRFANPLIVEARVKSVAGLPLMVKGRLLGVLYLHSLHPGAFHGQLPLLTTFANQVAIAVENARLYEGAQRELTERKRAEEKIKQRNRELAALNAIATTIMQSALDLDEALQRTADGVVEGLGCNTAFIFLLDEEEEVFKSGAVSTKDKMLGRINAVIGFPLLQIKIPARRDFNEAINNLLDGRPTIKHDFYELVRPLWSKPVCYAMQRLLDSKTFFTMPLIAKGKTVGGIVASTREELSEGETEKLMTFANQAAIAIENARLYEEAQQEITERKRAEEALCHSLEETASGQRTLLALSQAAQAVQRARTTEEVYQAIGDEVSRLGYHVVVFTLTDDREHLSITYMTFQPALLRTLEKLTGLSMQTFRLPLAQTIVFKRVLTAGGSSFDEPAADFMAGGLPEPVRPLAGRIASMLGLEQCITAPLAVGDETHGLLHVTGRGLTEADVPAVTAFANQAAIAIENARLFQESQRRADEMAALREVNLATLSTLEREQVFEIALDQLGTVIDYDTAAIHVVPPDGRQKMIAGRGPIIYDQAMWDGFDVKDNKLYQEMKEARQPIVIHDTHTDEHFERVGDWETFHSWAGAPLFVRGDSIGYLAVEKTSPGFYDEKAVQLLSDFAHAAAIAIENARLYDAVQQELTERKRAEEALRESEEKLKEAQSLGRIGNWEFDIDNQKIDWSDETYRLYERDPAFGPPTVQEEAAYYTPEQAEKLREYARRAIEEGEEFKYDLQAKLPSGKLAHFSATMRPVKDESGRIVKLFGTVQDITERKRAERLLRALNQAGLAMERALTLDEVFAVVSEELKRFGFSCVVFLTDESQSRLFGRYFSYEAKAIKALEKLTGLKIENLSIPIETADVYREVIWERKAAFIENVEDVTRQFLPKPLKKFTGRIMRMLKIAKSIPAPLVMEDEVIGLLSVESDDLTEGDIPAITAFAHQMAAAWRKAQLMQNLERSLTELEQAEEDLQRSFKQLQRTLEGTVNCLASAIEMRDPYTAGHQQRATQLACAIAKEMGLPEEQIEGLRIAALIHDIGKIHVPAEILSKPGRLSDLEFGLIKMHSQVGHDILKAVEFPWPVAQIVLQHHERMDGSGYPAGLSGEEIILEARILAVADVVEAMASHRPYRPSRGIDKTLEEISQNRGVLYDPDVVDACLRLFAEKRFEFE